MVLIKLEDAVLFSRLCDHWNNSELSDIRLKIDNSTIYSHKFLLAYHSKFFKTLFYNKNFSEKAKEGDFELSSNFDALILLQVFKSIYTLHGLETIDIPPRAIFEAIKIVDFYELNFIRKALLSFSSSTLLNSKDVYHTFSFAKKYNVSELISECQNFIAANASLMFANDYYFCFDEDLMISLLQRKDLDISELDIYRFVKKWASANGGDIGKKIEPMLQYICFAAIPAVDLIDEIQKDGYVPLQTLLDAHIYHTTKRKPSTGFWSRSSSLEWMYQQKLKIDGIRVMPIKESGDRAFTYLKKKFNPGYQARLKIKNDAKCSQLMVGIVHESVNLQASPLQNRTIFFGSDKKTYKNAKAISTDTPYSFTTDSIFEFTMESGKLSVLNQIGTQNEKTTVDVEEGDWFVAVAFGCCQNVSIEIESFKYREYVQKS